MRIFNINLFKNKKEKLNDKLVEHTRECDKIPGNAIVPEIYTNLDSLKNIKCRFCRRMIIK